MFNMVLSIIIFVVVYALIMSEKINKTIVVLLGASLMIIFHVINQDKAFEHIDMNVIFLLIGMMILVRIVEQTGIFQYFAIKLAKLAKGNPYLIMIMLFFMTALFSGLLDNITTVLLIAPISILIANELKITPYPFLITQIFASNIGGTATLIGDPPNIMIGSAAKLTFMDFLVNVTPLVLIQLVVFAGFFLLIFRKKMVVTNENRARIMDFDEKKLLKERPLLIKSLVVFGLVILGFAIHGFVDLEAAIIAIMGSMVLLLITDIKTETAFKNVEWSTIFFFIGLFMMVGALVETGAIKLLSTEMMAYTKGDVKLTSQIMLWFSGIFSGVIDNIPLTATVIPMVKDMGTQLGSEAIKPLWWALSLGACLGGNGTLIGASANVIVADLANKSGFKITFFSFLKYSIPVTLLSLLISYFYLMVRYF